MSGKRLIWMGMLVGSTVGGFLPGIWGGAGIFSGLIWGTVGGIAGIWGGYKLAKASGSL